MLGRKDFTRDELDAARTAVDQQLATYLALRRAVADAAAGGEVRTALGAVEASFFAGALLALDRRFVHRVRVVTGKDGNPLNEVELLAESIMNNGGVLRTGTVIRYVPDQTVLRLQPGDPISLSADGFARLADAFLTELEKRFVA